jgi:4-hydroxybenzoate polyprenyltransferase
MQRQTLAHYIALMRLNKPIGILLLLWPTLWALWLANYRFPSLKLLFIFVAGVILMRSAGCILNDLADRRVDGYVERTQYRPLVTGAVSVKEAWVLAGVCLLLAFLLVLQCNGLTIVLAFIGALLAIIYPLLKRITHLPQLGLGLAFAWGVPMAFAATLFVVSPAAWFLFLTAAVWPVMYDTIYAMVDRADDKKAGIKSTAILFGRFDTLMIAGLQLLFLIMLVKVGKLFLLNHFYYISLIITALLFLYQQWLIKDRNPARCFHAFLNNNWVGFVIFLGIVLSKLL